MITREERYRLYQKTVPEGVIGYDCEGNGIKGGDTVEVIVEDKLRSRIPELDFCGVGKRGKATPHFSFPVGWFVSVTFDEHESVGCVDFHLRIITPTIAAK